jgi:hypothetical protein
MLPLAIGHFQHAGYDSFCLGLVLFFVTIGWWLRHRDDRGVAPYVVIAVLLALTYLAHLVTAAMALGVMVVVILWEMYTHADEGKGRRRLSALAVATIPLVLLILVYLGRRNGVSGILRIGPLQELKDLITMRPALASLAHAEIYAALLVGLTFIGIALYTLLRLAPHRLRHPSHAWLVATLAAIAAYFVTPDSIGDGGQISARLILIVVMTAMLWFAVFRYSRIMLAVIVVLSLVATGALTALHIPKYVAFNRDVNEFTSVGSQIPPGSTALSLIFVQSEDQLPGFASSFSTGPLFQSMDYLVAERNIVDLSHFNGGLSYFITQYRSDVNPFTYIGHGQNWLADSPPNVDLLDYSALTQGKGQLDYVITWGEDQAPASVKASPKYNEVRAQLAQGFELVATSDRGHAKLYRRR